MEYGDQLKYDEQYKDKLKELKDEKLSKEYERAKETLYKGYRYGLWDIPENTLITMITEIEFELASRKEQG